MIEFKVGQTVCIQEVDDTPFKLVEVAFVGARKMRLADGTEWDSQGFQPWGVRDPYYRGPSVRHMRDGDADAILAKRYARKLGAVKWPDLPLATLRSVWTVLEKAKVQP